MPLRKIISGGQSGVDRAALDAAIELGIEHGGYCPRGRRAEDGRIPKRYCLEELASADYPPRTAQNVDAADATCLITRGPPTGGSRLTFEIARQRNRPLLHLDLERSPDPAAELRRFCGENAVEVLNIAGPRASHAPELGVEVLRLLRSVFGRSTQDL